MLYNKITCKMKTIICKMIISRREPMNNRKSCKNIGKFEQMKGRLCVYC